MKTKKEILDGLNYHIEQLQELNKVRDAVKELGVMDNQYARMMLSIKLSEKLNELHTSAWMLDHYMEQLNQLEEGTIDNDEPVTEDDLPFDGKEEKE
jgi:hypothetical protein